MASLSPEQQQLYEAQTGGALAAGQAGRAALERVAPTLGLGFDLSGLPARYGPISPSNYGRFTGDIPEFQSSLDFSAAGGLPTAGDYAARAGEVGDALYEQATRYLDPQFERRQAALETQLANQGVAPGSEAHASAMSDLAQEREIAYSSARDRAIAASGAEQSRLTADVLAGRGQELNRILAAGQFGNQAQQAQLDAQLQSLGFNNAAEAQQFADALAAGQFAGAERTSALGEEAFARQLPLQEALSLYGIGAPQTPTFQGGGGGVSVAPTDILGATQAQYGNALDLYNAQAQQKAGKKGNLTDLGAAGIAAYPWSDRRLKFGIEKIGHVRETGLPVYVYTKFGQKEIGVMADEVRELHPEAVIRDVSGYDKVDYNKIPGTVELQ